MSDSRELAELLERIDGRGYKAYKDIRGNWAFADYVLHIDHVQGDPFAAPSRMRVTLTPEVAGYPENCLRSRARRLGTAGFLNRCIYRATRKRNQGLKGRRRAGGDGRGGGRPGSGKSGEIRVEDPGQKVLDQTAVILEPDGRLEARFTLGLPARGRRVLGSMAIRILLEELPVLVAETLLASVYETSTLESRAAANEDADALREQLETRGLVAFVADAAVLPRRSGIDDRPLADETVVSFRSPESLRVTLEAPNAGDITGMGIPRGVTLIVGGGFHGKSTLLRALEAGVYNHCPGDGRERCVTRGDAVKVRAEDGRSVAGVDISAFIGELPGARDTRAFSTPNASGSTSQAAAILESVEAGAGALLIDEDTSATNFMIRDRRMQSLVPKEGEPITPFVDRVRDLYERAGISSVLVIGGSGDYLDVADTVLRMRDFRAEDVTARAREVSEAVPTGRESETASTWRAPAPRLLLRGSLDARKGRRDTHIRVHDDRTLTVGTTTIDLAAVEQLANRSQIRAIGLALAFLGRRDPATISITEALDLIELTVAEGGLDALDPRRPGDLSEFRRFELAAVLNRARSLRVE